MTSTLPAEVTDLIRQTLGADPTLHLDLGAGIGTIVGQTHLVQAGGRWAAVTRGLSIDPWRILTLASGESPRVERTGFQPVLLLNDASGVTHRLEVPFLDRSRAETFLATLPDHASAKPGASGSFAASPPWMSSPGSATLVTSSSVTSPSATSSGTRPIAAPSPASLPSASSVVRAPVMAAVSSPVATSSRSPEPEKSLGFGRVEVVGPMLSDDELKALDESIATAIARRALGEARAGFRAYLVGCAALERTGVERCSRAVDDLIAGDIDAAFHTMALEQVHEQDALTAIWVHIAEELEKKRDSRAEIARVKAEDLGADAARARLARAGVDIDAELDGLLARATEYFTRKVSEQPSIARWRYELATALSEDIEPEQALVHARAALSHAPMSIAYVLLVARCLVELDRTDEAYGLLRASVDSGTRDLRVHIALAEVLHTLEKDPGAIALLVTCLEKAPRETDVYDALAELLEDARVPPAIVPRLELVMTRAPMLVDTTLDTIVTALKRSSRTEPGPRSRSRAIAKAPTPERRADPWERPPDSTPGDRLAKSPTRGKPADPGKPMMGLFVGMIALAIAFRVVMHLLVK